MSIYALDFTNLMTALWVTALALYTFGILLYAMENLGNYQQDGQVTRPIWRLWGLALVIVIVAVTILFLKGCGIVKILYSYPVQ